MSVVLVALVATAQVFVPIFADGVEDLAEDVRALLSGEGRPDEPGGGASPGSPGSPSDPPPGNGPIPFEGGGPEGDTGAGGGAGGSDDGSGEQPPPDDGGNSGDDPGNDPEEAEEEEEEEESVCPYVYDEASGRWRDPETGQYVSFANASAAGC